MSELRFMLLGDVGPASGALSSPGSAGSPLDTGAIESRNMRTIRRGRAAFVSAATTLALGMVSLSFVTAPPARADAVGSIIGDVNEIQSLNGQIQQEFNTVLGYLTGNKPVSELDKIKDLIAQSQTAIINEIDAVATAQLQGVCDTALDQFGSITSIESLNDAQLASLVNEAVTCVATAKNLIASESANSKAAIDADGLALNAVAPIALAVKAASNQSTDILTGYIIDGNQTLLTKLKPTCGGTPDDGVDVHGLTEAAIPVPGVGGEVAVPGHGACYNYAAGPPAKISDVTYFPAGKGTGALPWSITGDGQAEFCAVFHCGDKVTWPVLSDYSIAINEAMAATSYPIAQATLGTLAPSATPFASPLAITSPGPNSPLVTPVPVFRVTADGALDRGSVTPAADNNGDVDFSGWTRDTSADAPILKSIASTFTWDSRVQVFGLDRIGRVFTQWQRKPHDDSSWSAWAQLDGTLNSISVARNHNGALQIFGTDAKNGKIYTRVQVLNGDFAPAQAPVGSNIHPAIDNWTGWKTFDGALSLSQIAAWTGGLNEIIGVTSDGVLFERHQGTIDAWDPTVSGNWTDWVQYSNGRGPARSMAIFADLGGALNILATYDDNTSYVYSGSGTWRQTPGFVTNATAAKGGGSAGRVYAIASDLNGNDALTSDAGFNGDTWPNWYCPLDTARHCTHPPLPNEEGGVVTFQSQQGALETYDAAGGHPTQWSMAPNTSPAIARLGGFQHEIAFVAPGNILWVIDSDGTGRSTGLQLWPGTSPAIAADTHGGWMIAAQDKDSRLWTIDSAGNQIKTPSAMSPTSPAITHLATGGYKIAFNASDGHLWVQDAGIPGGSGHGTWLIPATSPAIAADNYGNWKIAIEGAGTYHLVTLDSAGTVTDTGAIMAANTSPSIAGLAFDGGYEMGYNASDGFLWQIDPSGSRYRSSNGLGVAPGTSPSVEGGSQQDWKFAFHALGDHLWTLSKSGVQNDTGILLAPNTSPAYAL